MTFIKMLAMLCISAGFIGDEVDNWLTMPPEDFVPLEKSRLPTHSVIEVSKDHKNEALSLLADKVAISLPANEAERLSGAAVDDARRFYLIRTVSDVVPGGALSIFESEGLVVSIWTTFGGCQSPEKSAVIIEAQWDVKQVAMVCSGPH